MKFAAHHRRHLDASRIIRQSHHLMFHLKFLISLLFISGVLDAMMVHPRSLPRPRARDPDLPPPQHGGHALNWENVHDRAVPG